MVLLMATLRGWRALAQQFPMTPALNKREFPKRPYALDDPLWQLPGCRHRSHGTKAVDYVPFLSRASATVCAWDWDSFQARRNYAWFTRVRLLLGREENIPFTIGGRVADPIRRRPVQTGRSNLSSRSAWSGQLRTRCPHL